MSKMTDSKEVRPEYDFSHGVRGKHHRDFQEGTNVVLLEPDVANIFKDSASVNHALRMLMNLAGKEVQRNLKEG